MKKYEYKFVKQDAKLGFAQNKKIEDAEKEWNILGNGDGSFARRALE